MRGFVLTTVFLLCLIHKKKAQAAAPTGIAAANVELPWEKHVVAIAVCAPI